MNDATPGSDLSSKLGSPLGESRGSRLDSGSAASAAPPQLTDASVHGDKYAQMLELADMFDKAGEQMRSWAGLGDAVLADEDVERSAELSPTTFAQAADDIRAATSGKRGLLARSVELDADALVVRATVLTYRWIDELQAAAYETLGSIAGRAIGYLAPEVALGGAIVSAGLIETDALDRDSVAGYLSELAENNPDLLEHVSTGGGLLDGLQLRSVLTVGVLASERGSQAATEGLQAMGVAPLALDTSAVLRDAVGAVLSASDDTAETGADADAAGVGAAPRTLEDLMQNLCDTESSVVVQSVGAGRYIAYLPGPGGARPGGLRLVSGDPGVYAAQVVSAIEAAVAGEPEPRVMLVGSAQGGAAAAEIAAAAISDRFVIDQVVAVGAPAASVPRIPRQCRMLSLEDRSDPVALLGSLINQRVPNRLTVVYDGAALKREQESTAYVAGGRAADRSEHPELRAEIQRMAELGFLAG